MSTVSQLHELFPPSRAGAWPLFWALVALFHRSYELCHTVPATFRTSLSRVMGHLQRRAFERRFKTLREEAGLSSSVGTPDPNAVQTLVYRCVQDLWAMEDWYEHVGVAFAAKSKMLAKQAFFSRLSALLARTCEGARKDMAGSPDAVVDPNMLSLLTAFRQLHVQWWHSLPPPSPFPHAPLAPVVRAWIKLLTREVREAKEGGGAVCDGKVCVWGEGMPM